MKKLATAVLMLFLWNSPSWATLDAYEKMGIAKSKKSKPAPDFSVRDIQGNEVRLEDFKGKVIFLNFWATWCEPCKKELPSMQRLYESLDRDKFEILAVSIDRGNEDRVREFVNKYNLTFPVLIDPDQKIRKRYFVMGLPTSYLIDTHGTLQGFVSGAREWDSEDSKQVMLSLE